MDNAWIGLWSDDASTIASEEVNILGSSRDIVMKSAWIMGVTIGCKVFPTRNIHGYPREVQKPAVYCVYKKN